MPNTKLSKKSSKDQIALILADKLESEICSGALPPGTKLPTEAALGQRFRASRTPVREAIQILKAKGLLYTRQGSGSYVANESGQSLGQSMERYASLQSDRVSFLELLELRLLLETSCVRSVAELKSKQALVEMQKHLKNMETWVRDLPRFGQEDMNFHLAIAAGANNSLFKKILNSMLPTLGSRFAAVTYTNIEQARKNLKDHKNIYRAVKAGDADGAEALMRKHLEESRDHFKEMLEE